MKKLRYIAIFAALLIPTASFAQADNVLHLNNTPDRGSDQGNFNNNNDGRGGNDNNNNRGGDNRGGDDRGGPSFDRDHGSGYGGGKPKLPGSISGTTFLDPNGSGNPSVFQKLVNRRGGVTVYLDTNNNGKLNAGESVQVSDFFGNYTFSNLPSGMTYHVREVPPSGYHTTYPSSGVYDESLSSGQHVTGDVFANYLPTRGHRWFDNWF
jgi:hypothetical protein